ncbi:MAG: aldo/keto reductase [Verrucomicrobia bacterium]|nr:aldo/keto reductase [Verrucomicrobiota bacterium]
MKRNRLGTSGIVVSELCLGTMTFGSSCDETTAHKIMDRAYEAGVDFFDTAEIYPVPPEEKWVHRTEEIVGRWLKDKPRHSLILATKVTGAGHAWFVPPVRNGKTALDRHNIRTAIEGSLRRLQTDFIDLYQIHWPDHDAGYEEILEVMTELIHEGKVRIIGSSNENEWGTMKARAVSEANGFARYQTIQNNYSINNRRFEDALADICRREKIGLLPYSPLAGGVLTGKYNVEELPDGIRFTHYIKRGDERQKGMARRFVNDKSLATTLELKGVAEKEGITLPQLALAWSKQHDFVPSTIFGVNNLEQLEENLKVEGMTLSEDALAEIDKISEKYPYPMG